MSFLQGLHGVVALALLCGLLFAEEAGVPLPFAPGELVLLVAGLLIAAGGLNAYVFIPIALVVCAAGAVVGYTWARVVGERGLTTLARRLHQQRNLERVSGRIRSAGWAGIAISRLIPGFRIYTTLVAGAARVPRSAFVIGMVPATVVWVGVYVALGALVGIPIEHFLSRLQQLALQGAILIVMGIGCYIAIRKTPASSGAGLVRLARPIRVLIAAALDVGVVASVITGLLALGRILGVGFGAGWVDAVIALLVVGAFYVVIARRSGGATVGEALLHTSYASGPDRLHPRAALQAARALFSERGHRVAATADLFRALSDPERLHIVSWLLRSPSTLRELTSFTGMTSFEVRHHLSRLRGVGMLAVTGDEPGAVYGIWADLSPFLTELLSVAAAGLPVEDAREQNEVVGSGRRKGEVASERRDEASQPS
jgi:membrane-associated protein